MNFYSQTFQDLDLKFESNILWVFFDRQHARNAFSDEMIDSLVSVLDHANYDDEVRVIVLSGRGKAFNAGGDLKQMKEREGMFAGDANQLRQRYSSGIQKIPLTIERIQKPLIAAVNGAAIGAGLDVACMCDIRYGSENAVFGETFVKLSLIPGDGGTYFLPRVVGIGKAMEMTLTGAIYNASQAKQMGLVNDVFSPDDLHNEVEKIAISIAKNAPIAVSLAKRGLRHSHDTTLSTHLDMMAAYQAIAQKSDDHREGVEAILDRRDPNFKGS